MPKPSAFANEDFAFHAAFPSVLTSGVETKFFDIIAQAAGMTVSQAAGKLNIASGTTTNEETILRSTRPFVGDLVFKAAVALSQRIANQSFYVELVDVVGDLLSYTINSATSVTVTFPGGDTPNPFTQDHIGQYVNLGAIAGTANVIPGRYAIASVAANKVTFTVASWPSSGSGTLSLFGWDYHRWTYDGTTATTAKYDSQRTGWNSGDTTFAINTTASPGQCLVTRIENGVATAADQLVASSPAVVPSIRASRVVNVPQDTRQLYVQLRVVNGTSSPASSTTLTLGSVSVDALTQAADEVEGALAVFKNTIVLAGHSFIERSQSAELTFGPHSGAPSGNALIYSRSVFDRANKLLGCPLTVIGCKGVSGETSTQILARFSAVLALNPSWIYLDCYSNDPFNGIATATSVANTKDMINQARALGINVVLALDLPRGSAVQMTQAILTQFMDYAHTMEGFAETTTGLLVFNQWPYWVDFTSYTTAVQGTPDAAYINADTIHPVAIGAGRAAVGLAALLRPFMPKRAARVGTNSSSTGTGDPNNVYKNPLALAGTGGFWGSGGSGSNPQDWWGQRIAGSGITGVGSIVNRSTLATDFPNTFTADDVGKAVKIVLASSSAATDEFAIGCRPYDNALGPLVASTGPWYAEVDVGAKATSGTISILQLALTFKTSGANYLVTDNYNADAGEYLGLTKFDGVLRTRPFYLPSTFSGADSTNSFYVRCGTSSGGGAELYVSNPVLRLVRS